MFSKKQRITAAEVSLVSAHLTPSLTRSLWLDRRDRGAAAIDGLRAFDGRSNGEALERHIQ